MTLNTESALTSGLIIQRLTELYEDPIEATVRETVSNAIDAVIESNIENPLVEITSPTSLQPILIIKDNGVGMTYEDLKNVYSKYGASTKASNLDQIGAYGLGAKSPLAYGDEFTITSIKDGYKTTVIVVKEELTNYIKIVDSVYTGESSGTTVSVPVNSSDIERFKESVNKYKESIVPDVTMSIDGVTITNDDHILLDTGVLIYDGDEKVYSNIWVKKTDIAELLNQSPDRIREFMKYVIGGWTYNSPENRNRYYSRGASLILELKAGIVSFNSSRDAILNNDRFEILGKLIDKHIESEAFYESIISSINKLDIDTFKTVSVQILESNLNQANIVNNRITIKEDTQYIYGINIGQKLKFDKLKHDETGFTFNDILDNIPPNKSKSTMVISEQKRSYKKTPDTYIMDDSKLHYSQYDNARVSFINEEIDRIFIDKQGSHDLSILMTSLARMLSKDPSKVLVKFITDIKDENEIKQLKSRRKGIINMINNNNNNTDLNTILIYTEHSKKDIAKMIEILDANKEIKIETAEKTLLSVKEFYKLNRQKNKSVVDKTLNTNLYKYDSTRGTVSSIGRDIEKIDENKNNVIVVTRDSIYSNKSKKMHIWYCNENNLKPEEVNLYISSGNHRVIDIQLLLDKTENVMRDPESRSAGTSKLYQEKIHDNVIGMDMVDYKLIDTSQKATMRIITALCNNSATIVSHNIQRHLDEAYKLAKIANIEMPKMPTDKLKTISEYDKHTFYDINDYGWDLDRKSTNELIKLINKDEIEFIENVALMCNRSTRIEDGEITYTRDILPQYRSDKVETMYTKDKKEKAYAKYERYSFEGYIEFIKSSIKTMELIDF